MNKAFDDLVARLTERFKVDPELRLEIGHELRTHLEDCAAEFKAGGASQEESEKSAIKAMGDETELAEKLWQANRGRIRVRKTIRWAAGVTLIPAAGAAAVSIAWSGIVSFALLMSTLAMIPKQIAYWPRQNETNGNPIYAIAEHSRQNLLQSLSDESKLVFQASFPPGIAQFALANALENGKALADRYPNDSVYWANYALRMYECLSTSTDARKIPSLEAVLERGKQLDPDNALYWMLKAEVLWNAATRNVADIDPKPVGFDFTLPSHKRVRDEFYFYEYHVTDPALFEQALAEFHEAASKATFNSYTVELAQRSLALLPPPVTLHDWAMQTNYEGQIQLPYILFLNTEIWTAGSFAYHAAEQGDGKRAIQILHDARRLALLALQHCHLLWELEYVEGAIRESLGVDTMVYQRLNRPRDFEMAVARFEGVWRDDSDIQRQVRAQFGNLKNSAMDNMLIPNGVDKTRIDLPAGRSMEYAMFDSLGLSFLLILLLLAALFWIGRGGIARLRGGAESAFLFVGWRRLAKVVLISTALPLCVYGVYVWLTPWGGRDFGAVWSLDRLMVEYAVVATACFILLRTLNDRAVQQRLAELGGGAIRLADPGRLRIATGAVLALVVVAYMIGWHAAWLGVHFHINFISDGIGISIAIIVMLYAVDWLLRAATVPSSRRMIRQQIAFRGCLVAIGILAAIPTILMSMPSSAISTWFLDTTCAIALTLISLSGWQWLGCKLSTQSPLHDASSTFNHGLTTVPSLIMTALALAIMAGLPLGLQERQAVAAMVAPGADYDHLHELDHSYLRETKARVDALLAQQARLDNTMP